MNLSDMENLISLPGTTAFLPPQFDRRRWAVLAGALAAIAGIGALDYTTGWELSLFLFYAAPILFVVWHGYNRAAVSVAVLSGVVWWIANGSGHPYHSEWSYGWASLSRAVYLLLVAVGGNALRAKQVADRERIRALERAQELEREIVGVSEIERNRIGQDLHDGLCQQLAAVGCAARSLADDLRARSSPEAAEAEKLEVYLRESVDQARSIAHGILPVVTRGSGLAAAIEALASSTGDLTGMRVEYREEGDVSMDDLDAAMHLYRIAQEALANAVRHSGAKRVVISLNGNGGVLRLRIADNGRGFSGSPEARSGLGFRTMIYRARAVGADLSITSDFGRGTVVSCVYGRSKRNRPWV
jgi:signal transduction histidine kinase